MYHERKQTDLIYQVPAGYYVFFRNIGGGYSSLDAKSCGPLLLRRNRQTVLAYADHIWCVRNMRADNRISVEKNDKNSDTENCFVDNNTKSLRIMGKVSFLIVILFAVKCVLLPTPATFIIVLTFFIAGLFSHVLSLVFAEAVNYKEENDLTI